MSPTAPPTPALTNEQQAQLESYLDALLVANEHFNLTAITDRTQAWERHVLESLRFAPALDSNLSPKTLDPAQVLDLGSGGGLPGMVLAIARPQFNFTLLEATAKKALFLEQTARALSLENVRVVCDRAELAAASDGALRGTFDLVVARAVAALPTLLELAVPFLKQQGTLIAIKGERAQDELDQAKRALSVLNCEWVAQERQPSATLLFFRKTGKTPPKYPRRPGEPKRNPL